MDSSIFRWINGFADRTTWAHGITTAFARYGIALFAVLLVVTFLEARDADDHLALASAVWSGASALVALGAGQIIGGAIDRARPYETLGNVHVLIDKTTDFSFPSDHATVAGAVAVGLMLANRRWGLIAVVAAVAMAATRVYVGAHYPSDVVAGSLLGAAVATAGRFLVVSRLTKIVTRVSRTAARPLVSAQPTGVTT